MKHGMTTDLHIFGFKFELNSAFVGWKSVLIMPDSLKPFTAFLWQKLKQYILHKTVRSIEYGSGVLGTRWHNFQPLTDLGHRNA